MNQNIIYEQPLNERIRTFLRLEFLFAEAAHHLHGKTRWDARSTLSALLDIITLFGRTDLKTEILKELERYNATLARLEQNPDVDNRRLAETQRELESINRKLHASGGPIAASLRSNEFLTSIAQRAGIAGGSCEFDLPGYHYWLEQPAGERTRDLAAWLGHFEHVAQAIGLILKLVRESAQTRTVVAENGFFQKSLDPNLPCQLVRVTVNRNLPCFAEISGGRHRFTVRFLKPADGEHYQKQVSENIEFQLGCCII